MDRIIRKVEEDAESMFTRSTAYSGSTIYGIGASSGKAIKAVGEFLVNGVGSVRMRVRLRSIESQLSRPSGDQLTSDYRDLFEFARYVSVELCHRIILNRSRSVLYPDEIGRLAWELIVLALGTGRSPSIILVLSELLDSELLDSELLDSKSLVSDSQSREVQLFLKLLSAAKLSGWYESLSSPTFWNCLTELLEGKAIPSICPQYRTSTGPIYRLSRRAFTILSLPYSKSAQRFSTKHLALVILLFY